MSSRAFARRAAMSSVQDKGLSPSAVPREASSRAKVGKGWLRAASAAGIGVVSIASLSSVDSATSSARSRSKLSGSWSSSSTAPVLSNLVDEVDQAPVAQCKKLPTFPTLRTPIRGQRVIRRVRVGRRPVLPAIRRDQGRCERPWISAAIRSRSSCASRMRRKRIQVSSGTYCNALAQLERRMTSQTPLTKADSEPKD